VVDGARDELLAGAALAGDEHRRLRRRDFRGLAQRRAQRRRSPDDAIEAVPVVERALERGHARFEVSRATFRRRQATLLLREPLMLDHDRHLRGDGFRELDVAHVEPVRLALAEVERAADGVAEPERDGDAGSGPVVDHPAIAGMCGRQLDGRIPDHDDLAGLDP